MVSTIADEEIFTGHLSEPPDGAVGGIWRWENFTVSELSKQRDRGTLNLTPEYQREDSIHGDKWRRQLIADMLDQKTIPSIVLRELLSKLETADGLQRLAAIFAYGKAASMPSPNKSMDNFAWARKRNPDVPRFVPYVELTQLQQDRFDNYKLVAEVVTGMTDDEIRIEFINRNMSQTQTSGGERIHACPKDPATTAAINEIKGHPAFQRATKKRYRHLPGVVLVMFDILNDITGENRDRWDVEGILALQKISGTDSERVVRQAKPVLDEVEKVLMEWQKIQEKVGGRARKVYSSVIVRVLIPQLVHVLKDKGMFTTTGAKKYAKTIYDAVNGLAPQGSPFNAFRHGLDFASLEAKQNIEIFTNAAAPELFRDKKRRFNDADCSVMQERDGDGCRQCGAVVDLYGDHISPTWANGGRSDVSNGQLLCEDCHQRKNGVDAQKSRQHTQPEPEPTATYA